MSLMSRMRWSTAREEGYTLVEMMVVVAILGVVTTILTTTVIGSTQATGKARKKGYQGDQERVAVEAMARALRSAVRYDSTTSYFLTTGSTVNGKTVANNGREMWFYSNLSTSTTTACGPQVVHYFVDSSGRLMEERTVPDTTSVAGAWTYTTAPKFKRALVQNVVLPGGTVPQLFTYYPSPSASAFNGTDSLATLADSNSGSVGNVAVQLQTRTTGNQGATSATSQVIRLVNADAPAGSGAGC
jgi:prepilin-type N-terminal cleavage/methylation domain-containing protein